MFGDFTRFRYEFMRDDPSLRTKRQHVLRYSGPSPMSLLTQVTSENIKPSVAAFAIGIALFFCPFPMRLAFWHLCY
jgi:hypothetical protein